MIEGKPTIHLNTFLGKRAAEIHVSNHCNLNCIGCSHFSPLVKESFLEANQYREDMMSIPSNIRAYFSEIRLLGGEPLLNHEISEIIQITRETFKQASVVLVTNGICIPNMNDSFWESCSENRVTIGITEYPIQFDYSKIKSIIKNHDVNWFVYADRCGKGQFQKRPLSLKGQEKSNKNFFDCVFTKEWSCMQIVGTKLYYCPTCAYVRYFSEFFGLDIRCDEYLDLKKVKDIEEIAFFLLAVKEFCKYCALDRIENVDWEPSRQKMTEWM